MQEKGIIQEQGFIIEGFGFTKIEEDKKKKEKENKTEEK